MIGDKENFMTLKKERDGSVSFGNDNSTRIIGKGIVNLKSKDTTKKKIICRIHETHSSKCNSNV
jgi:hypothetical protein